MKVRFNFFALITFILLLQSCYVFRFDNSKLKYKSIKGNIIGANYKSFPNKRDSFIEVNSFNVFLIKKESDLEKRKLIYNSNNSAFDFIISRRNLRKFKYLQFECKYGYKIVRIDTIKGKLENLVLTNELRSILAGKPVIYLYPKKKQEISIIHNFKGEILNTYPEYYDEWKVVAEPSGKLYNLRDNKIYNYLFWDGKCEFKEEHFNYKSGFYVKDDELITFFQSKLSLIGLNNTEINDFIVYWLPILKKTKYNFIHFRINDNIDNSSILNVNPNPDTQIIVFMEFQGYDDIKNIITLPTQIIQKIKRKGFTLVEWGGANINTNYIE